MLVREVGESLEGVSPNTIGVEGIIISKVDYCLGGSLCRGGEEEDADSLVFAGGGGEGEYEGVF
eukprot:scaffold5054_cov160-Isochrysis_galbana.AAC.2